MFLLHKERKHDESMQFIAEFSKWAELEHTILGEKMGTKLREFHPFAPSRNPRRSLNKLFIFCSYFWMCLLRFRFILIPEVMPREREKLAGRIFVYRLSRLQ